MGDFFKSTSILILPILAYLLGWVYLDTYYDRFEIALSNLDLPVEHYFTIGFMALLRSFDNFGLDQSPARLLSQCALVLAAFIGCVVWLTPLPLARRIRPYVAFAMVPLAVAAAVLLAQQTAIANATIEPPLVVLELTADQPSLTANAGSATPHAFSQDLNFRLIYWDEHTVVVGNRGCPANSIHLREFADAQANEGGRDADSVLEPSPTQIRGFVRGLEQTSVWDVRVLSASRVREVRFTKAIQVSRRELEQRAFLDCVSRLELTRDQADPKVETVAPQEQAKPLDNIQDASPSVAQP